MNAQEALNIVFVAAEKALLTKIDHINLDKAQQVLLHALIPNAPVVKPEPKKDGLKLVDSKAEKKNPVSSLTQKK